MPSDQTPVHSVLGPVNDAFTEARPFDIPKNP